jgi:thiol-disulfide isomerase/thioredoxin/outer membrane lipoprotein-sorting protein
MFRAVVLLVLLPFQTGGNSSPDALKFLTEVSQRYSDAKSYRIEAVEEWTSNSELSRSWTKSYMTAVKASGSRYYFAGQSPAGNAEFVSDGTTAWAFLPDRKVYTQRSVAIDQEDKAHALLPEEMSAFNAKSIVPGLAESADLVKSATFLSDERLSIGTKSIVCHVVRISNGDFKVQRAGVTREEIFWIDASRKTFVKRVQHDVPLPGAPSNGKHPSETESVTIYPVVDLDQAEPASAFVFIPPSDAQKVEAFLHPLMPGPHSEFIGRPAPEIRMKSTDGQVATLDSFRGKPLFLDFWATWCGPCKGLIPDLTKLYSQTQTHGLVWVGIDSDENPDAAEKFVSQHQIPWKNYHDLDGSIGAAFHRSSVPLGVLVDANGKIVFYQSGYEISDLHAAIAKLGPEFSSALADTAHKE